MNRNIMKCKKCRFLLLLISSCVLCMTACANKPADSTKPTTQENVQNETPGDMEDGGTEDGIANEEEFFEE